MKHVHYMEKPVVLVSPAKVAESEYQSLFEAQGINSKIDYFGCEMYTMNPAIC